MIKSAHSTPIVRQTDRARPPLILIKLLHPQDKLKILSFHEKRQLFLNRVWIFIFPEYSTDLMRQRRSFDPVKWRLQEDFSLQYSCKLHVIIDGKEHEHELNRLDPVMRG